jgi:hypothetical protein
VYARIETYEWKICTSDISYLTGVFFHILVMCYTGARPSSERRISRRYEHFSIIIFQGQQYLHTKQAQALYIDLYSAHHRDINRFKVLTLKSVRSIYIDMDDINEHSKYDRGLYTAEARRDRFIRIAESRTNRILNDIRLLGNTGNKTLYNYSQADIDKIFSIVEKKLSETRTKFKTTKKEDLFTLD